MGRDRDIPQRRDHEGIGKQEADCLSKYAPSCALNADRMIDSKRRR